MKFWWSKKESTPEPETENEGRLLEETLPPPEPVIEQPKPTFMKVVKSIGVDDFKNINQIACLRNALFSGLGIGVITGGILAASTRNGRRAVNWGFGAFIAGSVFSWQQCRTRMHHSKMRIRMAQDAYKNKKPVEAGSDDEK